MNKYLTYISNNVNLVKYGLIIIFVLLFLRQCNQIEQLKTEVKQAETVANRNYNNLLASQDSIRIEKNKNGQLVSKIGSYQLEINSLSSQNKQLVKQYQRVLNLNQELEKTNSLISAKLEVKDSIKDAIPTVVYQTEDSISVQFTDDKNWDKYNWRKFDANIDLVRTNNLFQVDRSQFNFSQGISLTAAILKVNGRQELRISTPHPGVEFTQIENINLVNDKLNPTLQRPKNWSLGVGVQYGINLNNQQVVSWGPSIGVGLYYSPRWLRF